MQGGWLFFIWGGGCEGCEGAASAGARRWAGTAHVMTCGSAELSMCRCFGSHRPTRRHLWAGSRTASGNAGPGQLRSDEAYGEQRPSTVASIGRRRNTRPGCAQVRCQSLADPQRTWRIVRLHVTADSMSGGGSDHGDGKRQPRSGTSRMRACARARARPAGLTSGSTQGRAPAPLAAAARRRAAWGSGPRALAAAPGPAGRRRVCCGCRASCAPVGQKGAGAGAGAGRVITLICTCYYSYVKYVYVITHTYYYSYMNL